MELSQLTAYAGEKYHIDEQHKWADFPGFSVLVHPQTGQWVALLMRQWDPDRGEEIQRCDLKCGRQTLGEFPRSYLSDPIRMKGSKWISIAFDGRTEPELVFRLFDRAVTSGEQRGFTMVLDSLASLAQTVYQETAIPITAASGRLPKDPLPQRIRQMKRLYMGGREEFTEKAKNFYVQAKYMEDYEDDFPWKGGFVCYYPTYRDLTTDQLRGYFSWRTGVRKGVFQPIAASASYLYIYELLNGIGASSPEDALEKLRAFEKGFLDTGVGDARMKDNLRRWMLELAVISDIPPSEAVRYADPGMIMTDEAVSVLHRPEKHTDEEVFRALDLLYGGRLVKSPVLGSDPARGMHLFSQVWRKASSGYKVHDQDLFRLCFGGKTTRRWYPLSNAVYYDRTSREDRTYVLSEARTYRLRGGAWQVYAYDRDHFSKALFRGLVHQADLMLRRRLKTGRYLKEDPADRWACEYVDQVIEEEERAAKEASKARITIDLSGLDRIRQDAEYTRDSLLTEEDVDPPMAPEKAVKPAEAAFEPSVAAEEPGHTDDPLEELPEPSGPAGGQTEKGLGGMLLEPVLLAAVRALLAGGDAGPILREEHVMPSIAADQINEALYGAVGDSVVVCENDRLELVPDYAEELAEMLEGDI